MLIKSYNYKCNYYFISSRLSEKEAIIIKIASVLFHWNKKSCGVSLRFVSSHLTCEMKTVMFKSM